MLSHRPVLCVVALLSLAACKSDKPNQDTLAQDSTLSRDLQLANKDSSAQPQLKDVPTTAPAEPAPQPVERRRVAVTPTPRKVVTTPTPAPPPVVRTPAPVVTPSGNIVEKGPAATGGTEGRVGVVAAGTSLSLASGQRVCTNTNSVGDRITASLAQAVTGSNGVVIPAGATAVLEVTSLGRSNQAGENMNIGLVVRSVSYAGKSYPVDGEITYAQVDKVKSGSNDAGKVLGGAAVGAILGNILGGHSRTRGTIIGAAGGAAAGAVIANQTAKYDACIPSGGRITVRLDAPMSVQTASTGGVI